MRKNKKLIMALAIVLAIATATAGATFAWYTATDQAINHMETDQFSNRDVKISEIFDPTDPFNPGVKINKDVWAVNTSSTNALIRMSFAEGLLLLANNGNAAKVTSGWTGAAGTIPQLMSAKALAAGGVYNGWTNLATTPIPAPATFSAASVAPPTDVTVLYNVTVLDPGGPNEKTKYDFTAYHVINAPSTPYDGLYQLVEFKSVQNGNELTFSDWGYLEFQVSATESKTRWAALSQFAPPTAGSGYRDLTSYTLASPLKLNTAFAGSPTATDPLATDAIIDSNIELFFTDKVKTNLSACGKGDWWYNQGDGYFYYIGSVDSGTASNPILDAVGMKASATSEYCLAKFDLIVNMEAIQNVEEALSSTVGGGWGLNVTAGDGLALLTLLKSPAVNAFVQA